MLITWMSLAVGDPALNAIGCPSADQEGWDTAGSSLVRRRTPEPSGRMTNSASEPSRSDTNAMSPGAWSCVSGVRSAGGMLLDGVHPTSRETRIVTTSHLDWSTFGRIEHAFACGNAGKTARNYRRSGGLRELDHRKNRGYVRVKPTSSRPMTCRG
jgi:hypothetical protein